ncbi:innexin shaking-B-like [Parasteatoda tepidariorum]|uniref:innexin shaking-B-like n=1 Tax=Parasteatoda tepidariorum TaxID=114398 RepID=UPI00077FA315|nr:innexin shaking-B-like [Parasteatoda tepidariorum]
MLHIISAWKNIFSETEQFKLDHWMFRLHYRATVYILLMFCFLVSTKQYAGEPIRCSKNTQDHYSIVEIYCYITTTYTVTLALNMSPAEGAPHPGIFPTQDETQYQYHRYYQWVGFILFIQSIAFYLPHWAWLEFEKGKISWLLQDRGETKVYYNNQQYSKKDLIVEHLHSRWSVDNTYSVKYFGCEVACFVNILLQMELLDQLFDRQFYYYGIEAVNYLRWDSQTDPFSRMFPRVTSCTYRYLGESGMVRSTSVICLLAVNVINEKIFLFLWFWFVSLGVLTFFTILFRLIVFSFPSLRVTMLRTTYRNIPENDVKAVMETGNMGDFLFITLLGQNMNDILMKDVIVDFSAKIQGKHS